MSASSYDAYCGRCIHQQFELATGTLCGLTGRKPDLTRGCDDLVIDPQREKELEIAAQRRERYEELRAIDDAMNGVRTNRQGWRYSLYAALFAAIAWLMHMLQSHG